MMERTDRSNLLYSMNTTELRPGDIILTRSRESLSRMIRIVSKGKYSHAAIYIGRNLLMESVLEEGVRTTVANSIVSQQKKDIRVYRLKMLSENVDEITRNKIEKELVEAATRRWAAMYNYRGAAVAGLVNFFGYDDDLVSAPQSDDLSTPLFCSQFVAEVYEDASSLLKEDISLFPDHDIASVVPGSFLETPRLLEIKKAISDEPREIEEWQITSNELLNESFSEIKEIRIVERNAEGFLEELDELNIYMHGFFDSITRYYKSQVEQVNSYVHNCKNGIYQIQEAVKPLIGIPPFPIGDPRASNAKIILRANSMSREYLANQQKEHEKCWKSTKIQIDKYLKIAKSAGRFQQLVEVLSDYIAVHGIYIEVMKENVNACDESIKIFKRIFKHNLN